MIVIYAPYPPPDRVHDGWMRRIQIVDGLFSDRERVYVWPGASIWPAGFTDYRVRSEPRSDLASSLTLDLRLSHHRRELARLVHAADFVYAHTSHSSQHLLPYYPTGKIVTDLHGLAPEEEAMQGRPARAAFFGALEEPMVRGSACLVVVSRAMVAHFRAKYPALETPTILMPIVDDVRPLERAEGDAPPHVIYAGGAQTWQSVDRMMRAVAAAPTDVRFSFFTAQVPQMQAAAAAEGVLQRAHFATLDREELMRAYSRASLGFVLRADSPVNRVSCPTKLSEYLATGVVPIVDLVEIGDFDAHGYRYVRFEDFMAGRLPGAGELEAMRAHNREVYSRLRADFQAGIAELTAFTLERTTSDASDALELSTLERETIYPLVDAWLEVERGGETHRVELDDITGACVAIDRELPGDGALTALRLGLGRHPLVVTPVELCVTRTDGVEVPVELDADAVRDPHGNWSLAAPAAPLSAAPLAIESAARARLRFEILLAGNEALPYLLRPAPPAAEPPWPSARRVLRGVASRVRRRLKRRRG
jgi:hypothetical protein